MAELLVFLGKSTPDNESSIIPQVEADEQN
jgi:hypothetical protein